MCVTSCIDRTYGTLNFCEWCPVILPPFNGSFNSCLCGNHDNSILAIVIVRANSYHALICLTCQTLKVGRSLPCTAVDPKTVLDNELQ